MEFQTQQLGKWIELCYGKALPQSSRQSGSVPVYGSNGVIGQHNKYLIDFPTIAVGRKGSVGKVHYEEKPCWVIDTAYYVKVKSADIDLRFVYHFLKSIENRFAVGSGVKPGINRTEYLTTKIAIPFRDGKPDLAEQNRIADKLDKVFMEIEKGKKHTSFAIHKDVQFKLSFLKETFGDKRFKKINLEDITMRMKAGGTPNTATKNYWGGKIPFVKISDVTASKKYLEHTALTITQDGVDNSSTWIVPEGSLILSMYGTVGKVVINKMPVAITQNMAGIIPNKEKILLEYLYYALNFVETNTLKDFLKTSVHKHFGIGEANKIPIPVPYKNMAPDLTEQQHIVNTLNKAFSGAEKLEHLFDEQKTLFTQLRSSVLNQSFQMQT